ncbi:GAF domain-containing protein [Streptomyces tuirus]|uniref:GAF domain-containing protein n=1 Tax=Streptomyces tuirus TaxID=68278 RepID=A0A941FCB1_9ACTN|nr:GAF domain-containing protein [Streptomyces tuirus]
MPATSHIQTARERCSLALQSALSLEEVGHAFIATAGDLLASDALGLYRFENTVPVPVDVLSDAEGAFLQEYEEYGRADDPVLDFVLDHRRPIDSTRAGAPRRWAESGARAALAEVGLTQSLEAPLIAAGHLLGTINFARADLDRPFATVDLISARMLSEQLSLAIERALRHEMSHRRSSVLESALDRVPEGVIVSDLDGKVVFCNRAAGRVMSPSTSSGTATPPDGALAAMMSDAASTLRAGKRVHSNSVRLTDGSGHVVVKSWLQDQRQGVVVTLLNHGEAPVVGAQPALSVLSAREQEIARLVSEGLTSKQIAERTFITENTVKQHLKRIFAKTDVRNRAELVQLIWSSGSH